MELKIICGTDHLPELDTLIAFVEITLHTRKGSAPRKAILSRRVREYESSEHVQLALTADLIAEVTGKLTERQQEAFFGKYNHSGNEIK